MKIEQKRPRPWFLDLAYIRDGKIIHTKEAIVLALIAHTNAVGRNSESMKYVQRMMKDHNLDKEK